MKTSIWMSGQSILGLFLSTWFVAITIHSTSAEEATAIKRIGIIGLDTSHVVAFTKTINDPKATGDLAILEVTAAYPGGSPDIPKSIDRVPEYTQTLKSMNIAIVDSIDELLKQVDFVLLESVDGRPHLQQALPVIKAGKPLFIDKPLAGSLSEALAIESLAQKYQVRWFSSSSLRFSPNILKYRIDPSWPSNIVGAMAWSPSPYEEHHPDLFWYGIHGVETLFTVMGPGCETVTRIKTEGADDVVGTWKGGRIGSFRGIRQGKSDYGLMVFGDKTIEMGGKYEGYDPLVHRIAAFFLHDEMPVATTETIEIVAFMQAAQVSSEQKGCPVKIESVLNEARRESQSLLEKLGEATNRP